MEAEDFRRIALSLDSVVEGSHMGAVDFRLGGRIFATLAHQHRGWGNLMFDPMRQRLAIILNPELFFPVAGGWGRNGSTHIRLAEASEEQLAEALQQAWELRRDKNGKTKPRQRRG